MSKPPRLSSTRVLHTDCWSFNFRPLRVVATVVVDVGMVNTTVVLVVVVVVVVVVVIAIVVIALQTWPNPAHPQELSKQHANPNQWATPDAH